MTSSSTVVPLRQPDEIDDPLTAILRSGARRLLAQAVEAEAEAFLALSQGVGGGGAGRAARAPWAILRRWARRTGSLDALLPILYLRGVSMGDFQEALGALLGRDAPNLSPAVIARLRDAWQADYLRWQRRDLAARHYVYLWA